MSSIDNNEMDMDQFMEDFLNFGMEMSTSTHAPLSDSSQAASNLPGFRRQTSMGSSSRRSSQVSMGSSSRRGSTEGNTSSRKREGKKQPKPMNPQQVLRMIELHAHGNAADKAATYLHYDATTEATRRSSR